MIGSLSHSYFIGNINLETDKISQKTIITPILRQRITTFNAMSVDRSRQKSPHDNRTMRPSLITSTRNIRFPNSTSTQKETEREKERQIAGARARKRERAYGAYSFLFTPVTEILYAISINFTDIRGCAACTGNTQQQGNFIREPTTNEENATPRCQRRSPSLKRTNERWTRGQRGRGEVEGGKAAREVPREKNDGP